MTLKRKKSSSKRRMETEGKTLSFALINYGSTTSPGRLPRRRRMSSHKRRRIEQTFVHKISARKQIISRCSPCVLACFNERHVKALSNSFPLRVFHESVKFIKRAEEFAPSNELNMSTCTFHYCMSSKAPRLQIRSQGWLNSDDSLSVLANKQTHESSAALETQFICVLEQSRSFHGWIANWV